MDPVYLDLYNGLVNGLKEIDRNGSDLKKNIESSFHLSESIWRKVDTLSGERGFQTEADEISFFKKVKPAFKTLVEFYSILYRVELFIPDTRADQIEFWDYELQRAQLFVAQNGAILAYLESDRNDEDRKYFLKPQGSEAAQYDDIIARVLARKRYIEYINETILPRINL